MMKKGLVTIGIPCYNHSKYIDDCIDSILSQTYQAIEVIIIDDCSSDNSFDLINRRYREMKNRCENVHIEKNNSNLGICKTLNKIIDSANGEYIEILASDDALLPEGIEKMVKYMNDNPYILFLVGNQYSIPDSYSYGDKVCLDSQTDTEYLNSISNMHEMLLTGCNFYTAGNFYRAEIYNKYGKYDENLLFEDWDFLLTVTKSEKVYFVNIPFYLHRESLTSCENFQKQISEDVALKRFIFLYRGSVGVIKKHTMDLPISSQRTLMLVQMKAFLYRAVELNLKEGIKIVLSDMSEQRCLNRYAYLVKYWIRTHVKNSKESK